MPQELKEKIIKNDPLEVLFKSSDFTEGFKAGVSEKANALFTITNDLRLLIVRIEAIIMGGHKRRDIKKKISLWGIKSGNILLKKHFNSKDEAWEELIEMCGDKIEPINSSFKVVRL